MKKSKLEILVKELSEKYEQPSYVVNFWINAILDSISNCLKNNETLILKNFGTFTLRKRRATIRRNPYTQENFLDKEHFVPFLKFSKKLKTEIKKNTY